MDTPQRKKSHKGGSVVRTEPSDMHLFDVEPMVREVFQRVGCLSFCQNMQRGHPEVARQFALHFDGIKTKVGNLEFEVSEASIATTTEIPNTGERWFKSMILNASFSKDFLKPDYQKDNLSKGVPRSHLVEGFDKMLKIIQRYFTCEGRFNMIYQYHIRLLLHFTGKDSMNIPFYLLRSMGKMSDRVQAKSKAVDTSVFHSGLIRMLVMEELKKMNISWEQFIVSANMQLDIASTPQSRMQIPFPSSSVSPTRTSKKRKIKPTTQDKETPKEIEEEEREVHHSPQRYFSPPPAPELEEVPSSTKTTAKRGRKLHFPSPAPVAKTRVRRPFTRSSSHKEVVEAEVLPKVLVPRKEKDKGKVIEKPIEVIDRASIQQKDKGKSTEKPIEVININTPPSNPTFKRLIRQLRDARKEVARLKVESLTERRKMKELMDMYNETLDLERFSARRSLPLHRKLKTLYRKNISFQSQNRKLKEELQPFKDELAQRNLNVLVQAAIERDEPAVKRSTPTKERDAAMTEGSSPATRRSARLRK
jgi:hypothetical protein